MSVVELEYRLKDKQNINRVGIQHWIYLMNNNDKD